MVVIANAKPLLDQVADHRTGPDSRLIAGLDRPELDDDPQRLALLIGELRRRPLRDRSPKALDVIDVVPLEPAVHGATGNAAFGGDRGHLPSGNVRTDRTAATPLAEVVLELRFENELVELLQLRATATRTTDCLPGF